MTFTATNLKRLKNDLTNPNLHVCWKPDDWKELLGRLEAAENMFEWLEHSSDCALSYWEAGEPTQDGHYRVKYAGKWYIDDDKPKCHCGLNLAFESWRKAAGK